MFEHRSGGQIQNGVFVMRIVADAPDAEDRVQEVVDRQIIPTLPEHGGRAFAKKFASVAHGLAITGLPSQLKKLLEVTML